MKPPRELCCILPINTLPLRAVYPGISIFSPKNRINVGSRCKHMSMKKADESQSNVHKQAGRVYVCDGEKNKKKAHHRSRQRQNHAFHQVVSTQRFY